METAVAAEEWLKRIADFRLDPRQPVNRSVGRVRGPRTPLPIVFGGSA